MRDRRLKRVYTGTDAIACGWYESILTEAGIACLVRNRYLGGAIGELPLNEAWPEIWVVDDADAARAETLIANAATPRSVNGPDWECAGCGESLEAQFSACWRCGDSRSQ